MQAMQMIARSPKASLGVLGILGIIFMYLFWDLIQYVKLFDEHDLSYFFKYSQWAVGQGTLYKDVYSDYLLLPNLLFGCFHFLAKSLHPFTDEFKSFAWLWMSAAWLLYLWIAHIIYQEAGRLSLWIWLSPGALYFTLYRYEIYLVLLTFFFLFSLRKERYITSTLLLGIIIAVKGYALFILPAYLVYVLYRRGVLTALAVMSLAVAPYIVTHLIVFSYAGLDGLLMPYQFQANRPNTAETVYSAISYLFFTEVADRPQVPARVAQVIQLIVALIAAGLRPKTFEEWLHASTFALVGFISFNTVNSPQFFLWVIPMVCLSRSQLLKRLTIVLSWLSFLNYPIAQFLVGSKILKAKTIMLFASQISISTLVERTLFKIIVILMTAVRFGMMGTNLGYFLNRRIVNTPNAMSSRVEEERNSMIDFFDKTYIINLPERLDRRKAITQELKRVNVSVPNDRVIFFPAIKPNDQGDFPSIGTKGCFLSHLSVLKDARDRGLKNVLILEDDLVFTNLLIQQQAAVISQLRDLDWDWVYLGHSIETDSPKTVAFQPFSDGIMLAHFMAVNDKVLDPLIAFLEQVLERPGGHPEGGPMHVDGAYSTFRVRNPEFRTLIATPNLGFQRLSPSDIAGHKWYDDVPVFSQLVSTLRAAKNWWRKRLSS